ncbi:uncharacterized protein [Rutidosis leptorrhynchoides]|uniref:uncharacterized protein n=1 Tax=Rutidosis leptorrhynchoides TaxID=125765 RepID=UPI003A997FEF
MKLNPSKCSFGMKEGRFLGFMFTPRGIKANPKKIQAIENMQSPRNKKDVQSLNGKLAALTRFLSRTADRSPPFFQTLKGCLNKKDFVWMEDVEKAFQDMKAFLKELPTLTAQILGETLMVYLSASSEAISSVLIADMGKTQMPVYFVSKLLQNGEVNYPAMEKLIYALVHTARQLQRYFQAHLIQVLMDQTIRHVLTWPEISGRMAKWAIELGEHEISFLSRNFVKGQVIADFLVELPGDTIKQGKTLVTRRDTDEFWELYTDGASSEEGAGIGLHLVSPNGEEITYAIRLKFVASNNEAEDEALITGLRLAKSIDVQQFTAYVDSQLVASQLNGSFEARDTSMQKYLELAKTLVKNFVAFEVKKIPLNRNKKADALSKLVSLLYDHFTKKVVVKVLERKSTDEDTLMATVTVEENCWMTPFIQYLAGSNLPEDKLQARRIRMRAPMYHFKDGILYRKSFTEPYLRCVGPTQAKEIVQEMHEGAYSTHSGYGTIVSRIKRMGYFWPHMYRDTYNLIVNCEACQIHALINRSPRRNMVPIHAAWPFCKWGIDIVGPFPRGIENVKFLANGHVKVTNRDIVAGIKARLGKHRQGWVDELQHVLWAHRTTPKDSTNDTPFILLYGTEVVIPAEIYHHKKCLLAFIGRRTTLEEPSWIMRVFDQIIDGPVLLYKHLDHTHA